jgi:hypothetical protein
VSADRFDYIPVSSWNQTIPANHPIRTLKVDPIDLKSAFLTSIDRGELRYDAVKNLQFAYNGNVEVAYTLVLENEAFAKRLLGNSVKTIDKDDTTKEIRQQVNQERRELQEYKDMIEDANANASGDWELSFVKDMGSKYTRKSELTPRQLEKLSKISTRRNIPGNTPSVNKTIKPTPKGKISFDEFLDLCEETMGTNEQSFIQSVRRKYESWGALSPAQKKWLQDIYTRGGKRNMPDERSMP